MKTNQNLDNIRQAIAIAGGPSAVARSLNIGTAWAVSKWAINGIPPDRILPLLELSNYRFKPHEIDPDVYPENLTKTA